MWRWSAPPTGRRGSQADVEPFLYDMGRRLARGGPDRLPRRRDDAGRDHGGGKAAILDSAADGDRRPPAEERRGAGGGGRGRGAAAGEMTGAGWRSGSWRSPRDRRAARGRGWRRRPARWRRPDAAQVIVDRALELIGESSAELTRGPGVGRPSCSGKTRRVHFIGIGGIGMSGIAELLANLGYVVTGRTRSARRVTDRLATLGISVRVRARGGARGRAPTSSWSRRRCGRRTRRSSKRRAGRFR